MARRGGLTGVSGALGSGCPASQPWKLCPRSVSSPTHTVIETTHGNGPIVVVGKIPAADAALPSARVNRRGWPRKPEGFTGSKRGRGLEPVGLLVFGDHDAGQWTTRRYGRIDVREDEMRLRGEQGPDPRNVVREVHVDRVSID